MAKIRDLSLGEVSGICDIGRALSSPERIEIIRLLYKENLIIGEIAKALGIPQSSAAFHVKLLEKAGLIRMEEQPGSRGVMKLCSRRYDLLSVNLLDHASDVHAVLNQELPVGAYSHCSVMPTCGLSTAEHVISMEDAEYSFYLPERLYASLLWSAGGFVEYRFANPLPYKSLINRLSFSLELCSEAPGYKEDWQSEITVWINGIDCGAWLSPGDFGSHRGRLTPAFWPDGSSQYGMLKTWEVSGEGCFIDKEKIRDTPISALALADHPFIGVRVGNADTATFRGGFNIFGKHFGDYAQDIILSIEYQPSSF